MRKGKVVGGIGLWGKISNLYEICLVWVIRYLIRDVE